MKAAPWLAIAVVALATSAFAIQWALGAARRSCSTSPTAGYQKALRLNPDQRYTRCRMASCYMRLGDYGSARLEHRRLVAASYPGFGPLIEAVARTAAAAGAFR